MPIQHCTHIFPDGHTCGSPALRSERLCFYHHPTRRASVRSTHHARRGFTLAAPTNRRELLAALNQVIRRLASNKLDTKRAGILLYSLQVASQSLPPDA
jgi:hypothetical protein